MKQGNKFEHELNNIRVLASSEKLTQSEKGELFSEFCERYDIEMKQLTAMLTGKEIGNTREEGGAEYKDMNRSVSIYRRLKAATEEEKEIIKGVADRTKWVLLRIKEPNKDKKIKFMVDNIKGMPTKEIETLVSILNGDKSINDYAKKVKQDFEDRMRFIKKFKKEMLLLSR